VYRLYVKISYIGIGWAVFSISVPYSREAILKDIKSVLLLAVHLPDDWMHCIDYIIDA